MALGNEENSAIEPFKKTGVEDCDEIAGKQFNRRFRTGIIALVLITVAFYVSMFKAVEIDWFIEYAKLVVFIAGAVILGITTTDAITNWKRSYK